MKKIIYTRPDDGGISVIIPAPKADIERSLGISLTDGQYEEHVWVRSIPDDAIDPRYVEDEHIPGSREFRDAWCDVSDSPIVDIDCEKAKDIQLSKLRDKRNESLAASDVEMTRALEDGDAEKIAEIKTKRTALRNATEPLKALDTAGKINDDELLNTIRSLGTL